MQAGEMVDDVFELAAFLAQRLGLFGVVPDLGVLEFAEDLGQSFLFGFEVKDTP
jgi:hypothetical protein